MHDLLRDLKNLKQQRNVSTDSLAEQSGISRATIARLWADDADPRMATMVEVARVLGASLILSTSTSRQAFNEQDIRPYRELLAEKERIIDAKTETVHALREEVDALRKQARKAEQRERRLFAIAVAVICGLTAAVVIAVLL